MEQEGCTRSIASLDIVQSLLWIFIITFIIIIHNYDLTQSQHSAENLAGTEGKFEGKSLLYVVNLKVMYI